MGWQSSGGSGRLWHSSSLTGTFKDIGVTDPNDQNKAVAFADDVFIVLSERYSSLYGILVPSGSFAIWKKVKTSVYSFSSSHDDAGANDFWLACGMSDVITIRHPEADAVLPDLKPEFGTVYIKAK